MFVPVWCRRLQPAEINQVPAFARDRIIEPTASGACHARPKSSSRPRRGDSSDDKRHTRAYHGVMKSFRWSSEKNESLAADRGVSFEIVTVAIGADGLLDILAHPNQEKYPRQRVFVVAVDGYAYLVPFVEEDDYVFLKTIIPSRKATRDYLQKGEADAED